MKQKSHGSFALLNPSQATGPGAITHNRLALIQWHNFLQVYMPVKVSINTSSCHGNVCQTHYGLQWSIFFITTTLFYLTHVSCRIVDIYTIFRATALLCFTKKATCVPAHVSVYVPFRKWTRCSIQLLSCIREICFYADPCAFYIPSCCKIHGVNMYEP